MRKVYVVILNWNGWQDTIECLESVFRNDYPDYRVVVCDNDSTDGSIGHIRAWARGELDAWVPHDNPLRRLSQPPVPKPIPVAEHGRTEAECGGEPADDAARLVIIRTGANLGFAGGNNVGLRYALAREDFDYVWLLNNDTVIEPDALTHLLKRMEERPGAGVCGSTLPFYHNPRLLWARGGAIYRHWIAFARCIDQGRPVGEPADVDDVERRIAYIAGASMLVSRKFLQEIGLMCEDYFLNFEEIDWSVRARGRFRLAWAPGSIVYHKVGASTDAIGRTLRDHIFRNTILFTKKFYPTALPTIYLSVFLQRAVALVRDTFGWRARKEPRWPSRS